MGRTLIQITMKVPEKLKHKVIEESEERDMSASAYIRNLVKKEMRAPQIEENKIIKPQLCARLSTCLKPEQYEWVREKALNMGVSVSQYIKKITEINIENAPA